MAALVGSRGAFCFRPAGRVRLKGLPQPLAAVFVDWDGAAAAPAAKTSPAPRRASRGPRLVGREREVAVLHEALVRAASGQFTCVLLEGDPGVGKTRLADEVAAGASTLALTARAYPLGDTAAFGVWVEALERCFHELPTKNSPEIPSSLHTAPYGVAAADRGDRLEKLRADYREEAETRFGVPRSNRRDGWIRVK